MKKIVLEEINRIREIIGLKSLILEKSGAVDELTDLISHVYGKGGARAIDDYITSMGRTVRFPGQAADEALDSWTKLYDYMRKSIDPNTGARIYTNIDSVIPGLADSLIVKIFSDDSTLKQGLEYVSNKIFPEELVKSMKLWDKGLLTPEKALLVRQDVLDLITNLKNPQIKQAYLDLAAKDGDNLFKNFLNDTPSYSKGPRLEGTELKLEVNKLRERLTKEKNYELTAKDINNLDDAKFFGQISEEEWRKITSMKYENAVKYWKLYDEFKVLKANGKIESSSSFEDWLIETAKAKSPSKMTEATIKTIRTALHPFLRVLGIVKSGSFKTALLKIGGLTVTSVAFALNDLIELIQAAAGAGAEAIAEKKYELIAAQRFKEYWNQDSPKVTFDGKEYKPIFSDPDGVNYDKMMEFRQTQPNVTVINPEQQLISIVPDKISLGGKMVSEFYFVLANTFLGFGNNQFTSNVDVIVPKSTETSGSEQPKNEEQPKTEKIVDATVEEYTISDTAPTEDEIEEVFKVMEENNWTPNAKDIPFVKKVEGGDGKKFEFTGPSGKKYLITID